MLARATVLLDSSIGRTPLVPLPRLAASFGAGEVLAKVESANPGGCHKDRSALWMVEDALASGARGITAGTCGSVGLALARLARLAGLPAVAFIPARYRMAPVDRIRALGAGVVRCDGGYEDAVAASAAYARAHRFYDANPTGGGGPASMRAYESIADEIVSQQGGLPASVWVPVGNGTTLAGVGRGFERLARALGAPPPRACGAGSAGNTAAVRSILEGRVVELDPRAMRESALNEPLLNWRSAHAAEAVATVRATGGCAHEATDDELAAMAALVARDGVRALPAACATLAGLRAALADGRLAAGVHVVLLTA